MSSPLHTDSVPATRRFGDLLLGALLLAAYAIPLGGALDRGGSYLAVVGAFYAAVAATVLLRIPRDAPGPGLGWANRVTLGRAILAVPVAGLTFAPGEISAAVLWAAIGISALALCLDGVDGWVARRTRTQSDFGARFDMETDAALLMVLSILVWRSGQAGVWVLAIGAMRYLFVASAAFVPAMRGELPPSFRRKVVCVVQGVGLLVGLAPFLAPVVASIVAATALAALTWSFAVDTAWLLRKETTGIGTPRPAR